MAVISKGSFDEILSKLNSWDNELVFTSEKMIENSLIFLNCEIFIKNGEI